LYNIKTDSVKYRLDMWFVAGLLYLRARFELRPVHMGT